MIIGCSHNMDVSLKHPFSMIIAGSRRAGKSEFTKRLLLQNERLIFPQVYLDLFNMAGRTVFRIVITT